MKAAYCVVGRDIAVTGSTMQELKNAVHGLILGNPDMIYVWQSDAIGESALYLSTDEADARRFIVRDQEGAE